MASGVKLCKKALDIFNEMKVVKNEANEKDRIRLMCLQIDDEVKVEQSFTQEDVDKMEGKDVFQYLMNLAKGKLKETCRYIVYDCHYATSEASNKEELVFIMWTPSEAPIKEKMHYACSKGCLSKITGGVKHKLEITDHADFSKDSFIKELGKSICSLEGHACSGFDHGNHHDDHAAAAKCSK